MFAYTWRYFASLNSDEPLQNHNKTSVLDKILTCPNELCAEEIHHLNENNSCLWPQWRDQKFNVFWFWCVSLFFTTWMVMQTWCIQTRWVMLVAMMDRYHQNSQDPGWLNLVRLGHFPSSSMKYLWKKSLFIHFWERQRERQRKREVENPKQDPHCQHTIFDNVHFSEKIIWSVQIFSLFSSWRNVIVVVHKQQMLFDMLSVIFSF